MAEPSSTLRPTNCTARCPPRPCCHKDRVHNSKGRTRADAGRRRSPAAGARRAADCAAEGSRGGDEKGGVVGSSSSAVDMSSVTTVPRGLARREPGLVGVAFYSDGVCPLSRGLTRLANRGRARPAAPSRQQSPCWPGLAVVPLTARRAGPGRATEGWLAAGWLCSRSLRSLRPS